MQFTKVHQELAKPVYEAIPKIAEKAGKRWEWEPRRGEFVLRQPLGEVDLITRILVHGMLRLSSEDACLFFDKHASRFIPLLHWERIVKILEGMGYTVKLRDRYNCGIYTDKLGVGRSASTWQEATQKAVLALAEKLEAREEA